MQDNKWARLLAYVTGLVNQRLLLQNEPTVEIFHEGLRVASHARSFVAVQATTIPEHRPKAHQQYLEWTPSRLLSWADAAEPHTAQLFRQILATKPASGNGPPFLPRPSAPERQTHHRALEGSRRARPEGVNHPSSIFFSTCLDVDSMAL